MKLAGVFGEKSEAIAKEEGIAYFFWILTFVSICIGILALIATPLVKRLMHGVK